MVHMETIWEKMTFKKYAVSSGKHASKFNVLIEMQVCFKKFSCLLI